MSRVEEDLSEAGNCKVMTTQDTRIYLEGICWSAIKQTISWESTNRNNEHGGTVSSTAQVIGRMQNPV